MVKYALFEKKVDQENQTYLSSVGVMQAPTLQDAIKALTLRSGEFLDSSYSGGQLLIAPKSAFSVVKTKNR